MSGPAQLYLDYLAGEGYRPTVDSDGDVIFKDEGKTYYIEVDTNDAEYFRLVFPNFWEIESDAERERVIRAANYATMKTKVAKVYMRSDGKDTVASIEMFLSQPEQFKAVFPRAMSALRSSVNNFVEAMKQSSN
jgi:predicted aspartyl protease